MQNLLKHSGNLLLGLLFLGLLILPISSLGLLNPHSEGTRAPEAQQVLSSQDEKQNLPPADVMQYMLQFESSESTESTEPSL